MIHPQEDKNQTPQTKQQKARKQLRGKTELKEAMVSMDVRKED